MSKERTKTIDEYECKNLLVADFVKYTDGKCMIQIIDNEDNVVYRGRQEYLSCSIEGCSHLLCDYTVNYYNTSNNGDMMIYVNDKIVEVYDKYGRLLSMDDSKKYYSFLWE